MEKYPVKPNITVTLPDRTATAPSRKRNRRQKYIKPEDQIRYLKKVRNLLIVLLVTALLAFGATALMILELLERNEIDLNIGQNYETVEPSDTE